VVPDLDTSERFTCTPTAVVAGGDALARDPGGRVVFVAGALPAERVAVEVVGGGRGFARARVVDVLDPAPGRVEPPCPMVARGCGGCGWQHVDPATQRDLKETIVVDALRRIGGLDDPPVDETVALPATHYRTSLRVVGAAGRPALRRRGSHEPVPLDGCAVAHPLLDDLLRTGTFADGVEVDLRAGARTAERLALATPTARDLVLPADVVAVGADDPDAVRAARYHEEVAGERYRVSAGAFFQVRPDGADELARLVLAAVDGAEKAVDLYAGVGLFARLLALGGSRVVAVEGNRAAARDARHNLAGLPARVVACDVRRFRPVPADVVVADPSRAGLGRAGTAAVVGGAPRRVVLVSCDPASLARDVALLADAGYLLAKVTLVDLFPHTPHVETVAVLDRVGARRRP